VPLALLAIGPATDGTGALLANRASPILIQAQVRANPGVRAGRREGGLGRTAF